MKWQRERDEMEVWNMKWVGDGDEEKLIVRLRDGMFVKERKSEGGKRCLSYIIS